MKNLYICIILAFSSIGIYAQNVKRDTSLYRIFKENRKTSYIFAVDTSTIILKRIKKYKGDKILYVNNRVIDTVVNEFRSYLPDLYNNRLLFFEYKENKDNLYFFDLVTYSFKHQITLPNNDYKGLVNGKLYAAEKIRKSDSPIIKMPGEVSGGIKSENELIKRILSYDTVHRKETEIIDIDKYTIDKFEDIENFTLSPNSKKILLQLGIYESGDYTNRRYLVYRFSENNMKTMEYKQLLNPLYSDPSINLYGIFYDLNSNFYDNSYSDYYDPQKTIVLNDRFEFIDTVLSRSTNNIGFIFKNNKIKGFYFNSFIYENNKRKDVIIPSIMNYKFEKLLSNIYYEIKIKKEDLEEYNTDELLLLKNMIYAKHNYQFEDDYYQAYFNLYRFYNTQEKRNSRLKDVSKLLTPIDKENLKLINKTLKSLE